MFVKQIIPVGTLLVLMLSLVAGCSTDPGATVVSTGPGSGAVGSADVDSSGRDESGLPTGSPGVALEPAQVRCLAAKDPAVPDSTTATVVPCSQSHLFEEFELSGRDLQSCVTTIARSSDLVVVPDPDKPGRFEIDDDRVSGYSYSTGGAGVECQITLDRAQSGALLG